MIATYDAILMYWDGYFPDSNLIPDYETVGCWIKKYPLQKIQTAISIGVRKHRENSAAGKPMSLAPLCRYIEGVLARMDEYQTMPMPVCPNCGEVLDQNGACAKTVQ